MSKISLIIDGIITQETKSDEFGVLDFKHWTFDLGLGTWDLGLFQVARIPSLSAVLYKAEPSRKAMTRLK